MVGLSMKDSPSISYSTTIVFSFYPLATTFISCMRLRKPQSTFPPNRGFLNGTFKFRTFY